MYKALVDDLEMVVEAIVEYKEGLGSEWVEHCQTLLRANSGWDVSEFVEFVIWNMRNSMLSDKVKIELKKVAEKLVEMDDSANYKGLNNWLNSRVDNWLNIIHSILSIYLTFIVNLL